MANYGRAGTLAGAVIGLIYAIKGPAIPGITEPKFKTTPNKIIYLLSAAGPGAIAGYAIGTIIDTY